MVHELAVSTAVLAAGHGSGKHIPLIVLGCVVVIGIIIFVLWQRQK
jgi:hypothetical protein